MTQLEEQVSAALRQGYAITPRAQGPPQEGAYLAAVRQLAVETVYAIWNVQHRPATLQQIYFSVTARIRSPLPFLTVEWKKHWIAPSKRTIDRRVNEAADPKFSQEETPIVGLRPGVYIPNPRKFDGATRSELEKLLL